LHSEDESSESYAVPANGWTLKHKIRINNGQTNPMRFWYERSITTAKFVLSSEIA